MSSNQQQPVRVEQAGTYEMLWDCEYCGTPKLLGLTHRFCPNCGARQDADQRYFPPEEEKIAVQDHQYVGADRVCAACDNPNAAKAEFCTQCGGPLSGAAEAKRQHENPPLSQSAHQAAPTNPRMRRNVLFLLLGAGILILIGAYFLLATKPVTVTLEGPQWSRSIAIETYGAVSRSAWCDQMPGNAYNVSRTQEVRSHRQVPDGETCQTRRLDQGDGTYREQRECRPKYRQEPIYDSRCRFSVNEWKVQRHATASGQDYAPRWPEVRLGKKGRCMGCEREGRRKAEYSWLLRDPKGKTLQCERPEDQWRGGKAGTAWVVQVGLTGPRCASLTPAR